MSGERNTHEGRDSGGGYGTRLTEETDVRPKPMVEIGGQPILWHIMKIYSAYGFNDFVICCGYKGDLIKEYFVELRPAPVDSPFDLENDTIEVHNARRRAWRITLVDTGETLTGGRVKRVADHLGEEPSASPTATGSPTSTSRRSWRSTARRASSPRSPRCSPPAASARSRSSDRRQARAELPREARRDGVDQRRLLRAASRRSSTTSRATPVWEHEPMEAWPPKASSRPTATTASGSRWTPCATSSCSKELWARQRALEGLGPHSMRREAS